MIAEGSGLLQALQLCSVDVRAPQHAPIYSPLPAPSRPFRGKCGIACFTTPGIIPVIPSLRPMKHHLRVPLHLDDDVTLPLSISCKRQDHPCQVLFDLRIGRYSGVFVISKNNFGWHQSAVEQFFSRFTRLLEGRVNTAVLRQDEGARLDLERAGPRHFWLSIRSVSRQSRAFRFLEEPPRIMFSPMRLNGWALGAAAISLPSARALHDFMLSAWKHFNTAASSANNL
jgi:hypothetical protein